MALTPSAPTSKNDQQGFCIKGTSNALFWIPVGAKLQLSVPFYHCVAVLECITIGLASE